MYLVASPCIIFLVLPLPPAGRLKRTEIYCVLVQEARCPKAGCRWGRAPSEVAGERAVSGPSPSFWWLPQILDIPWPVDISLQSPPLSSHGVLCASVFPYFLLLIRKPVTLDLELTLIKYDFILT